MARIDSKVVFLTTSPRTPAKMSPEIALLDQYFGGYPWNHATQTAFMGVLKDQNFFHGKGENDPAFSARDRISRAPQTLGFVTLKPVIALTPAGRALISARRTDEIFLRQLLKFQIPSPYHVPSGKAAPFRIKPYLEILRLIRYFGTLKFDELKMFALQLTDYRDFDRIVQKIEAFRSAKEHNRGSYRDFAGQYFENELREIYSHQLASGDTSTRESTNSSATNFLRTKASNMRDYADACFRYLRATGVVKVSHVGKSLSIADEKIADVDFILRTVDREPCFVDDRAAYIAYLGDTDTPVLLTDNRTNLVDKIATTFPEIATDDTIGLQELKDIYADALERRKDETLHRQVRELKDFRAYDSVQDTFRQILNGELYDAPLMLEWNTWRAMTMLNGGDIKANLRFDDFGEPLSTAQGNQPDIVCDYGDFAVAVEVTMASGQKQYEMEGEPVSRHLGKLKKACGKPAYCLFVAPNINEACIAHFFTLHKLDIPFYGGRSIIVPLPLAVFRQMLEQTRTAHDKPTAESIRRLFEFSRESAGATDNPDTWYRELIEAALDWTV